MAPLQAIVAMADNRGYMCPEKNLTIRKRTRDQQLARIF